MHDRMRTLAVAVGFAVLVGPALACAEDVPAAPAAGGIKELPGTVQKDAGDAVQKDVGGMLPGAAVGGGTAGAAAGAAAPDAAGAAVPGAAGAAAAGGGVKELPGTVEGHAGDAVKKDIGGMVPGGAAAGGAAAAGTAAGGAAAGDDKDDEEGE